MENQNLLQKASELYKSGQLPEAEQVLTGILHLQPENIATLHTLGMIAYDNKQYRRAVNLISKAIALSPPNAALFSNRGLALYHLNDVKASLEDYFKAISINPHIAVTHFNQGNSLKLSRQFYGAVQSFVNALAIEPDYASAHWNKALTLLLLGHYETGWKEYEWRWKTKSFQSPRRNFSQPLWTGNESLEGKTILLHSEQGLGDTLQFCRYISLVADRGARIVLEVEHPLVGLLRPLDGITRLVPKGFALPDFDVHCPLLSLPLAFKTTLNTIPCFQKYLSGDPAKVSLWERRLGQKTAPRIGLVWSGRVDHHNDHNRSIRLSALLEYLPAGPRYISLQKQFTPGDRATLHSLKNISCFDNELEDFADTAALCELMDIVITVDTSVAHLSGALGRPTWVLLPFIPDWRWLLDREDSPWYPGAKLYRQMSHGNWNSVLSRVNNDLLKL